MKLSIVATLYQSQEFISEFHWWVSAVARELVGDDFEIVLVNDGSSDRSLEMAIELTEEDPHVLLVDLSRNFGHHKAMMAGLEHASGERVFLLDTDLEEEPEWLARFADTMDAQAVDVVYGRQKSRKGDWFERCSGSIYYKVFNWLSEIEHPPNIVTARLMTRRYVDALLRFREREVVISCLWIITGFDQYELLVDKHSKNSTTYSVRKKLAHATNAITSFSSVPLKLIFYFGMTIFLCSMLYASWLAARRFIYAQHVDGWTSVMVSVWVFGGLIISLIGVIGIYLAKIYSEAKQRPYTIVRHVYGRPKPKH